MPTPLSGPGLGLPLPQNLYPSELQNAPYDTPTNRVALAPGDTLPIPAGTWYITSNYCIVQYLDPVTGVWAAGPAAAWNGFVTYVKSDGFNCRLANLTGCPYEAIVAAFGSSYVQSSTSLTAVGGGQGGSTWLPIVGGALTSTITAAGAGYGLPPIVFIPAPPPAANNANGVGGIPATGYALISSGTLNRSTGFSLINQGAGYPSPFTVVALPSPNDPNIATGITLATIVFSISGSGSITGALCTNNGGTVADPNATTLSISGAGSNGSLAIQCMQTVIAASVSGQGLGYGTISALLTTVGGVPQAGSIASSPSSLGLAWRPRPAQIGLTVGATGTLGTQLGSIYDGGLFVTNTKPNYVIITQPTSQNTVSLTAATLALTMGGRPDFVAMQPAP